MKLTIYTRRINYFAQEFDIPMFHGSTAHNAWQYEYIGTTQHGEVYLFTHEPDIEINGFNLKKGHGLFIALTGCKIPDWEKSLKRVRDIEVKVDPTQDIGILTPLGFVVRQMRINKQTNLSEMSEYMGISSGRLSGIETGRKIPTRDELTLIGDFLSGLSREESNQRKKEREESRSKFMELMTRARGAE